MNDLQIQKRIDTDVAFIRKCERKSRLIVFATAWDAGECLIKLHAFLSANGKSHLWAAVVREKIGWSHDKATRIMQVARTMGRNTPHDKISPWSLQMLAAPSTPQGARDEALMLAEGGQNLKPIETKEIIDRHKEEDEIEFDLLAKGEAELRKKEQRKKDLQLTAQQQIEIWIRNLHKHTACARNLLDLIAGHYPEKYEALDLVDNF